MDIYPSLFLIREKNHPLPHALTSAEMCVIVETEIAIKAILWVFLTPGILFDRINYIILQMKVEKTAVLWWRYQRKFLLISAVLKNQISTEKVTLKKA